MKKLKVDLSVQEMYFILKFMRKETLADYIRDSFFQGGSVESVLNIIIYDKEDLKDDSNNSCN